MQFYSRVFVASCSVGILLTIVKAIQVLSLNPRELGVPRGAAEDWFLLALVLFAAAWSARKTFDIAMIGRAAIVVFALCFAVILAQDVIQISTGVMPRYMDNGSSLVRRSGTESGLMAVLFLILGVGVYQWRAWAHKLCLIVSLLFAVGCVAYIAEEGFNWKPLLTLPLLALVSVWLRLPVVRSRVRSGAAQ
jgi:hypothetical protein